MSWRLVHLHIQHTSSVPFYGCVLGHRAANDAVIFGVKHTTIESTMAARASCENNDADLLASIKQDFQSHIVFIFSPGHYDFKWTMKKTCEPQFQTALFWSWPQLTWTKWVN